MDWDLVTIFTFIIVLIVVRGYMRRLPPAGSGLSGGDEAALRQAMEVARRLEQRVESLEHLLDADAPGWRARVRA